MDILTKEVEKADCGEEKKQEIAQKIESVQKELETIQTALPTERIWQIIKKFKTEEISKLMVTIVTTLLLFMPCTFVCLTCLCKKRLPIAIIIGKTAKRPCLEFVLLFFLYMKRIIRTKQTNIEHTLYNKVFKLA